MAPRTPRDPLEVLRAARESVRKVQEMATKLSIPVEQRKALTDGLSRMVMPGEQLQAMVDLADAFGPANTQIAEIRETLTEQRDQLEQMLADVDRLDEKVARLAAACEQIAAMQEPFKPFLRLLEPQADRAADEVAGGDAVTGDTEASESDDPEDTPDT